MKKPLLFCLSFLLCVVISNAQITITQSNLPSIGMVAIENVDTVFTGITPGSAGTNQNWDFSAIANQTQDTTMFVNPSTLAGYSSFPSSNLGAVSTNSQDIFIYSGSSNFDILGLNGDFGPPVGVMSVTLNPFKRMITLPATYLTTYSGAYTYELKFPFNNPPIDSARMTSTVNYVNNIDGWGTITTPSFSNIQCLRQNISEISTTTTEVHMFGSWTPTGAPTEDTTITYSWWSDVYNFSLAEIETDGSGITTSAKYLALQYSGEKQNISAENSIKLYPNPATTQIKISGIKGDNYFVIYDVTGKIISGTLLTKNSNIINTSEFENGLYFYNIMDINGKIIEKGKFEVIK